MKRTHKKILGFCGLLLVAAMTLFAAFMPVPDTQAADGTTITDTVEVRVVSQAANINISGIVPGSNITSSSQHLKIDYENIENLTSTMTYTGLDGKVHEMPFLDLPVAYAVGVSNIDIDFKTGAYTYDYMYYDSTDDTIKTSTNNHGQLSHYGYGEYIMKAFGSSIDGTYYEALTDYTYQPVDTNITIEDGKAKVDLDYDPYDESGETDGDVAKIVIEVRDKGGKLINIQPNPNPMTITPPTKHFELDLSGYGLPTGTYTITATSYDIDGNVIYEPYTMEFYYEAPAIPAPNTGGIIGNLNISKTDYLITGLIIFGIAAVAGVVFITKNDKKRSTRRRK